MISGQKIFEYLDTLISQIESLDNRIVHNQMRNLLKQYKQFFKNVYKNPTLNVSFTGFPSIPTFLSDLNTMTKQKMIEYNSEFPKNMIPITDFEFTSLVFTQQLNWKIHKIQSNEDVFHFSIIASNDSTSIIITAKYRFIHNQLVCSIEEKYYKKGTAKKLIFDDLIWVYNCPKQKKYKEQFSYLLDAGTTFRVNITQQILNLTNTSLENFEREDLINVLAFRDNIYENAPFTHPEKATITKKLSRNSKTIGKILYTLPYRYEYERAYGGTFLGFKYGTIGITIFGSGIKTENEFTTLKTQLKNLKQYKSGTWELIHGQWIHKQYGRKSLFKCSKCKTKRQKIFLNSIPKWNCKCMNPSLYQIDEGEYIQIEPHNSIEPLGSN